MAIHRVVDDSLREQPRAGRWLETRTDLLAGNTVFIAQPDDEQAKNALIQAFRNTEWALHRSKRTVDGEVGLAFWLIAKA